MLPDLNHRLSDLIDLQHKQRKLQNLLDSARRDLAKNSSLLAELEAGLQKEGRDVQKLEGLSLTGLFYTILGSKEEQLDRERQEYLAAKLRFDRTSRAVQHLEQEVASLEAELSALGDVDTHYQSVMQMKEQLLLQGAGETSQQLLGLTEELGQAQAERRELDEAIRAGNVALDALQDMAGALEGARSWGTWDMLGGGLLATAAKHSRMDEAGELAHHVQQLLSRFQRELADLGSLPGELVLEAGSFERFADFFFDGLIVDWVVQSKIDRSLENTVAMHGQVGRIVGRLVGRLAAVQDRIDRLEGEKQRLVENA